MTKRMLLSLSMLAVATACQPLGLMADEVTLQAQLDVKPPRYGVQTVVQPYSATDIASVSVRVSEQGAPVASLAVAAGDLGKTLVVARLKRSKTYVVSAQAFDAGNQPISVDAASVATFLTTDTTYPATFSIPLQLKDRLFEGTATAPGGFGVRTGGYTNPSGAVSATVVTADPTPYTVDAPVDTLFDFTVRDDRKLPLYAGAGNYRYVTFALPYDFEFLGRTYPAGSLVTASNKGTLHFTNPDATIMVFAHPTDYWDASGAGYGIAYETFTNGVTVRWHVKDAGSEASFGLSLYSPTNASHSFDLYYGKVPVAFAGSARIGVNLLSGADTLYAPAIGTGDALKMVHVHP